MKKKLNKEPEGLFFFARYAAIGEILKPVKGAMRYVVFALLTMILLALAGYLLEQYLISNNIAKTVMPLPSQIFEYLRTDLTTDSKFFQETLLDKASQSFTDALIGFSISVVLGTMIGIAYAKLKAFKDLSKSVLFIIQLLPIPALAPVLAAMFGYDSGTKILIIVLFTIYPVVVTIEKSVLSIPTEYYSLLKSFNAKRLSTLVTLLLPGIVPSLLTTMTIISTASFTGSIIAELPLPITRGIGKDLYNSYNNQLSVRVWSSLVIIGLVGLLFYLSVTQISKFIREKFHYGEFE